MFKTVLISGMALLFALALIVGCGSKEKGTAEDTSTAAMASANLQKVTLDVYGMTCSGCEYNVESALKKIDGVAKADADYKNERAVVEFDPQVASVDELVEAINKSGYTAKAGTTN